MADTKHRRRDKPDFCIVGPGRVGTALAMLLSRAGWVFNGACGREEEGARRACRSVGAGRAVTVPRELTARSRLVLITTPDDAAAGVCEAVAHSKGFRSGSVVAHCSGVLSSAVLEPARRCGAHAGGLHPLHSFADAGEAAQSLPGSYCCIEGDEPAVDLLRLVACELRLHVLEVPAEKKALYHAGAVAACNFFTALQDIALEMESAAGVEPEEAIQAFRPLLQGAMRNIEQFGVVKALTGPFARGDHATIKLHLESIRRHCPGTLPAYRILGQRALGLGIKQGAVNRQCAEEIMNLLSREIT